MPDYIEELNEGQRNAVLYNDGPLSFVQFLYIIGHIRIILK